MNVFVVNINSANYTGYQSIERSRLKAKEAWYESHKSFLNKVD